MIEPASTKKGMASRNKGIKGIEQLLDDCLQRGPGKKMQGDHGHDDEHEARGTPASIKAANPQTMAAIMTLHPG